MAPEAIPNNNNREYGGIVNQAKDRLQMFPLKAKSENWKARVGADQSERSK